MMIIRMHVGTICSRMEAMIFFRNRFIDAFIILYFYLVPCQSGYYLLHYLNMQTPVKTTTKINTYGNKNLFRNTAKYEKSIQFFCRNFLRQIYNSITYLGFICLRILFGQFQIV